MKKLLLLTFGIILSLSAWSQTSGGPDAYGYTWKNSNHTVSPPSYSWVDISTKGTEIETLADDNVTGPFLVPQGFQFYWYPITQFWIGSNGYISFNGANQASPFPASIPLAGGANDWIAAHLSDLNFSGTTNPGQCFYYVNNDSIVVSFVNVPYWTVTSPGYTGSNTFQIIISSIDKSITINYQSMSAGTATTPVDCITGIENITGTLGLGTQIDVVPNNLFTIKYYYPPVVTYAVTDGGVNWNNNAKNGGFFIPVSNTPNTFIANVKNFGNQNLNSFTITDTIYSNTTALSNGSASVPALLAGEDTTLTFSNSFFSQFASIYKFSSRIQGITGDMVQVNNRKTQKIISVNTSTPTYDLDYSDGFPDLAGLSWQGGNGGIGVYIAPPKYPVTIESTRFYISANAVVPVGFYAKIYDDSGPYNGPGMLLDSVYVPPTSITVGTYTTVTPSNTNINITSGGVYVVWYMAGADIALARDLTPPISAQSYEILGKTWAEYRAKLTEDFLIGMTVSPAPGTVANFSIDTTMAPTISFTDLSTNSPTKWHWDFDFNSDTSNIQNPSYTYTTNGTYNVCLTASNALGGTTRCKTVTIRNIGIEEDLLNYKPFVYPNPAGNKAFIDLPLNTSPNDIELRIYNVYGQLMSVPYAANGQRFEMETSKLIKGVYFFDMTLKNQSQTFASGKFMVE